jgi:hypothetical protein
MPESRPQFAAWKPPQCPFLIECELTTLAETSREVAEGLRAPNGGVEVGGLLLGTFERHRLRILGYEPIPCEHFFGAPFILSQTDRRALAERLEAHRRQGYAVGYAVVGWYRTDFDDSPMRPEDVSLHNTFFPEPWHILFLRPDSNRGDGARFLCRGADGITQEHDAPLFREPAETQVLSPGPLPAPGAFELSPRIAAGKPAITAAALPQVPFPPKPRSHRNKLGWAFLAGMFALGVAVSFYFRSSASQASGPRSILQMDAANRDGMLDVIWDKDAIGDAQQGRLEVRNGSAQEQVTLDRKTLVSGRIPYKPIADIARFRLVVRQTNGAVLEGSTTFVAPDPRALRKVSEAPPKVVEHIAALPPALKPAVPVPQKSKQALTAPNPGVQATARQRPEDLQPAPQPLVKTTVQPQPAQRTEAPKPEAPKPAAPSTVKSDNLPIPDPIQIAQAPRQILPDRSVVLPGPPPASPPLTRPPVAPPPQFRLGGHWQLQTGGYSRSPATPESVSIQVTDTNGAVQGTLEARYRWRTKTDRIHFSFFGKVVNGSARCSWTTTDGRRGEIEFIRVPNSADMIEVVWHAPESKQIFDEVLKRSN